MGVWLGEGKGTECQYTARPTRVAVLECDMDPLSEREQTTHFRKLCRREWAHPRRSSIYSMLSDINGSSTHVNGVRTYLDVGIALHDLFDSR